MQWPDESTARSSFQALMAVIFMSILLGVSAAVAPNIGKALDAARWLYNIIEVQGSRRRDAEAKLGETMPPSKLTLRGAITLENVHFTYPSRPDAKVGLSRVRARRCHLLEALF